ncbi:MAG: cell division protein FtsZ [Lachnospiraceae bacterium]|nr:cell division protein FtsZ [Lachnospiraceae bacterium]
MLEISNTVDDTTARIMVMGVGGAGNNAINRMIDENIEGVEFVAVNTDKQDLIKNKATTTLQIGEKLTNGLGAGHNPEIGEKSAEESLEEISAAIKGVDMLFITAGMGGGTGTGACPVIAKAAKEQGILTVAVVTKPFLMEQKARMKRAVAGIDKLIENVDTLIVIPNEKIKGIIDSKTGFDMAFQMVDNVLQQSIRGITDLITVNGMINLDFADIQAVMTNQGYAHMGYGTGKGDNKFMDAVKMAVESPLLETSLDGAKNVILNITGDPAMAVFEANEATDYVTGFTGEDVELALGVMFDDTLVDEVRMTLIATGIDNVEGQSVSSSAVANKKNEGSSPMSNLNLKYTNQQTVKPTAPNVAPPATSMNTAPKKVAPVKSVTPPPTANSINQPNVKSNVEPKDIKIPDFLSKK